MLRKANQLLTEQRSMVRQQNQQLEELNTLKTKFLSILSHDIKAPLQGLKSYVGLLQRGEGMSQEMLDQLYRYDPMFSKTGTAGEAGTGLGLRICMEFAQLNRGQLIVKNNPGKPGSCFVLRLPHERA